MFQWLREKRYSPCHPIWNLQKYLNHQSVDQIRSRYQRNNHLVTQNTSHVGINSWKLTGCRIVVDAEGRCKCKGLWRKYSSSSCLHLQSWKNSQVATTIWLLCQSQQLQRPNSSWLKQISSFGVDKSTQRGQLRSRKTGLRTSSE